MLFEGSTNEFLRVEIIDQSNCQLLTEKIPSALTVLWFTENGSEFMIDNQLHSFNKNEILCLTEFHKLEVKKISQARMVKFNRPFYCILDHDSEVGCKGVLFFGSSTFSYVKLTKEDAKKYDIFWQVFLIEMESNDHLQLEMLQMMLKRLLILTTRVYKEQNLYDEFDNEKLDIVREFNFLVEIHFRSKKTVAEYAELLNRSPKTISNLFSKVGDKTPLQYIQDRIMLEARRLIRYTDKTMKEIAYEIGFEDLQSFSRFFKKREGVSPMNYKSGV